MAGKWDKEIKELFAIGFGAREIAKRLEIKHHSTVSKRLIKLDLRRPKGTNQTTVDESKLEIEFVRNKTRLHKAAQDYLKFICRMSNFRFLDPDEEEPFDLMVDFGFGYRKVQVKSSYCRIPSGACEFKLVRTRNNSTKTREVPYGIGDVDYFFLMDVDFNCWMIPYNKIKDQKNIVPAKRFPGYMVNLR